MVARTEPTSDGQSRPVVPTNMRAVADDGHRPASLITFITHRSSIGTRDPPAPVAVHDVHFFFDHRIAVFCVRPPPNEPDKEQRHPRGHSHGGPIFTVREPLVTWRHEEVVAEKHGKTRREDSSFGPGKPGGDDDSGNVDEVGDLVVQQRIDSRFKLSASAEAPRRMAVTPFSRARWKASGSIGVVVISAYETEENSVELVFGAIDD
jgi:hypothetical protein